MPIDDKAVEAYMGELADAAGITDATARSAFLGSDKVKASARKRFEDTERERGRAEAAEKRRTDEYTENMRRFNENKTIFDAANAKVARYVATYGELPDGGDPNDPNARRAAVQDVIDKKTFEEEGKKRDALTVGLVKAASRITARHLKDFNDVPDFDAIEKIAIEQGLTAEKAYDEWIKPKATERATADFDAKLKAAREEGYRDGVSKRAAGAVEDAQPKSGFYENMRKTTPDPAAQSPRDAFGDAWTGWKPPVRTV